MFYGILRGVGSTGAAVWRRLASFDVVRRGSNLRGAVDFLPKAGKFLENIEVPVVGRKSASLNTSIT